MRRNSRKLFNTMGINYTFYKGLQGVDCTRPVGRSGRSHPQTRGCGRRTRTGGRGVGPVAGRQCTIWPAEATCASSRSDPCGGARAALAWRHAWRRGRWVCAGNPKWGSWKSCRRGMPEAGRPDRTAGAAVGLSGRPPPSARAPCTRGEDGNYRKLTALTIVFLIAPSRPDRSGLDSTRTLRPPEIRDRTLIILKSPNTL